MHNHLVCTTFLFSSKDKKAGIFFRNRSARHGGAACRVALEAERHSTSCCREMEPPLLLRGFNTLTLHEVRENWEGQIPGRGLHVWHDCARTSDSRTWFVIARLVHVQDIICEWNFVSSGDIEFAIADYEPGPMTTRDLCVRNCEHASAWNLRVGSCIMKFFALTSNCKL